MKFGKDWRSIPSSLVNINEDKILMIVDGKEVRTGVLEDKVDPSPAKKACRRKDRHTAVYMDSGATLEEEENIFDLLSCVLFGLND